MNVGRKAVCALIMNSTCLFRMPVDKFLAVFGCFTNIVLSIGYRGLFRIGCVCLGLFDFLKTPMFLLQVVNLMTQMFVRKNFKNVGFSSSFASVKFMQTVWVA